MSPSDGPYRTPEPIEEEPEYLLTKYSLGNRESLDIPIDKPTAPGKWKLIHTTSIDKYHIYFTWKRVKER